MNIMLFYIIGSLTKRKLPQNILLAAYHTPLTIEQLCTEIGQRAVLFHDEEFFLFHHEYNALLYYRRKEKSHPDKQLFHIF